MTSSENKEEKQKFKFPITKQKYVPKKPKNNIKEDWSVKLGQQNTIREYEHDKSMPEYAESTLSMKPIEDHVLHVNDKAPCYLGPRTSMNSLIGKEDATLNSPKTDISKKLDAMVQETTARSEVKSTSLYEVQENIKKCDCCSKSKSLDEFKMYIRYNTTCNICVNDQAKGTERICRDCKVKKPISDYSKYFKYYRKVCKECLANRPSKFTKAAK